jgi:MFS family permease
VVVFVVSAFSGATFVAMFTFHQPYALSLGARNVAPFFVGFTVAAMAMRLLFGSLGDRLGRRRVATTALLVYAVAAQAVGHLHVDWLWAYGSLFGVAHGVFYPTLNAYAIEHAPATARGRVMAFYNGAFNLGSAVGALGWGALAHQSGYGAVFAPAAIVALLAAAILASPALRVRYSVSP